MVKHLSKTNLSITKIYSGEDAFIRSGKHKACFQIAAPLTMNSLSTEHQKNISNYTTTLMLTC